MFKLFFHISILGAVLTAPLCGVLEGHHLNPLPIYPSSLNRSLPNPSLPNPSLPNPSLPNPSLINPSLPNPSLINPSLLNRPSLNKLSLNPSLLTPSSLNKLPLDPSLLQRSLFQQASSGGLMLVSTEKTSEQAAFVTFTNMFIEGGKKRQETVIVPTVLYDQRHKAIVTRVRGRSIEILLRGYTLLEIDIAALGKNVLLHYRKRRYTGVFYTFIKDKEQLFPLSTLNIASLAGSSRAGSSQSASSKKARSNQTSASKNTAPDKTAMNPTQLRVIIDNTGGMITPILPLRSLTLDPSTIPYKIDKTNQASRRGRQVNGAYVFPPNEAFRVHVSDEQTLLKEAIVILSAAFKPSVKRAIHQRIAPLTYTYTFTGDDNALTMLLAKPGSKNSAYSSRVGDYSDKFSSSTGIDDLEGLEGLEGLNKLNNSGGNALNTGGSRTISLPFPAPLSIPLPYASNHLQLTLTDALGNKTETTALVLLDSRAPRVVVYGYEPKHHEKPFLLTNLRQSFQDRMQLYMNAVDDYSKTLRIFTARVPITGTKRQASNQLPTQSTPQATSQSSSGSSPPASSLTAQSSGATRTALPGAIRFQETVNFTQNPLIVKESTMVYYYSEDQFGNKSPIEVLTLEKTATLNPQTLIKSK